MENEMAIVTYEMVATKPDGLVVKQVFTTDMKGKTVLEVYQEVNKWNASFLHNLERKLTTYHYVIRTVTP
jgi:hypothetical protein